MTTGSNASRAPRTSSPCGAGERCRTANMAMSSTIAMSYQPSEESTDDGPVAGGDRGDAPGFGEKFSPGVLAGVKDVGVGGEHTVGEIGLSQILPDVLGCVEFRTGGWQRHEGDIGRWL